MDTGSTRKKFGRDAEKFRRRQAAALTAAMVRCRLTAKELAHAIGVHGDTILNWARGEGTMDGDAIEACELFFLHAGDFRFFIEIYGELGAYRIQRAREIEAVAREHRERAAGLFDDRKGAKR